MKKILKGTLIFSAMLMWLLVSGGNSTFAAGRLKIPDISVEELKKRSALNVLQNAFDYNGNVLALRYSNKEYYLVPADPQKESQGIIAEQWGDGKWAKFGSKSDAITVNLIDKSMRPIDAESLASGPPNIDLYKHSPIVVALKTNVTKLVEKKKYSRLGQHYTVIENEPTYLSAKSNGVEFVLKNDNPSSWLLHQLKLNKHYFVALKDGRSGKFLSYGSYGEWTYANSPYVQENTLWKLIEK